MQYIGSKKLRRSREFTSLVNPSTLVAPAKGRVTPKIQGHICGKTNFDYENES